MSASAEACDCKVGRVIEEFELTGMDEELAARRRGEEGGPTSLRDLAERFNLEVLRSAIRASDEEPLDGEVENTYRLLTGDDVTPSARIEARRRLERRDVDVDALESSFVSHPTMGRHLKRCLGVERSGDGGPDVETGKERIFKMQSRAEAVTENTLETLDSAGRLAASDLTVTVDTHVTCEECGFYSKVERFIERGGCDCDRPSAE